MGDATLQLLTSAKTPFHCNALHELRSASNPSQRDRQFLLGMYEYETTAIGGGSSRRGALASVSAGVDGTKAAVFPTVVTENLPGVFDVHQEPGSGFGDAAVLTCADGSVRVMKGAEVTATIKVGDTLLSGSCLTAPAGPTLLCSEQGGNLALMDVNVGQLLHRRAGHEFDAWTVKRFDPIALNSETADESAAAPWTVMSGGDDGFAIGWDLRSFQPIWKKRHDAGVVHFAYHPTNTSQLFVGSYDESVYLYDSRSMKSPVSSLAIGGGAWRLRPRQGANGNVDLAVAAMQGGAVAVRCDSAGQLSVLARSKAKSGEEPLIYDAWFLTDDGCEMLACDYYANALEVWGVHAP